MSLVLPAQQNSLYIVSSSNGPIMQPNKVFISGSVSHKLVITIPKSIVQNALPQQIVDSNHSSAALKTSSLKRVRPESSDNTEEKVSDNDDRPTKRLRLSNKENGHSPIEKHQMLEYTVETLPWEDKKILKVALKQYSYNVNQLLADYWEKRLNLVTLMANYQKLRMLDAHRQFTQLGASLNFSSQGEELEISDTQINSQEYWEHMNQQVVQLYAETRWNPIAMPFYWDNTIDNCAYMPVALDSREGENLIALFSNPPTGTTYTVASIQRVQNREQYSHYALTQAAIAERNGNHTNEKWLFHGCASENISSITEKGFDLRVAKFKGVCGLGLYFAEHVSTSVKYIKNCPSNSMQVLLCRVELGLATSKDELLKSHPKASAANVIRRPQRRSLSDPNPYDSVYANMNDDPSMPMHVVYNKDQVYPEYIITFSKSTSSVQSAVSNQEFWWSSEYKKQLEIAKKFLEPLEFFLTNEDNKQINDYPHFLNLYQLIISNPDDPNSIHQIRMVSLTKLKDLVSLYNDYVNLYPYLFHPS